MSRGPKLREKCLNLCPYPVQPASLTTFHPSPPPPRCHPFSNPGSPLFIPLFSLASSLSFDARQGELNRTASRPLFSSLEIICGRPLSSLVRRAKLAPTPPLTSPGYLLLSAIELLVRELLSEPKLCVLLIPAVANLLSPTFSTPLPRCFVLVDAYPKTPCPRSFYALGSLSFSHSLSLSLSRKKERSIGPAGIGWNRARFDRIERIFR